MKDLKKGVVAAVAAFALLAATVVIPTEADARGGGRGGGGGFRGGGFRHGGFRHGGFGFRHGGFGFRRFGYGYRGGYYRACPIYWHYSYYFGRCVPN